MNFENCSACSFLIVLFSDLSSFFMCKLLVSAQLKTQEELPANQELSLCELFSSLVFFPKNSGYGGLLNISTVSSTQGNCGALFELRIFGWSNCKDHCPALPIVQCLKTTVSYTLILFSVLSSLRWKDKPSSCYSIMARRAIDPVLTVMLTTPSCDCLQTTTYLPPHHSPSRLKPVLAHYYF